MNNIFMRVIKYFSIIFLFFLLTTSCENHQKKISVYTISKDFNPILEKIINNEKKLSYYNEKNSGFDFTIRKYHNTNDYFISIGGIFLDSFNYSDSYGVFKYQGHLFFCNDLFVKDILHKTNEFYVIKNDNRENIKFEDDTFAGWYLIYSNGKIKNAGHFSPENSSK